MQIVAPRNPLIKSQNFPAILFSREPIKVELWEHSKGLMHLEGLAMEFEGRNLRVNWSSDNVMTEFYLNDRLKGREPSLDDCNAFFSYLRILRTTYTDVEAFIRRNPLLEDKIK